MLFITVICACRILLHWLDSFDLVAIMTLVGMLQFLESMDFQLLAVEDEAGTKEGMADLLVSHNFDFDFSYGGHTISAEEMLVSQFVFCSLLFFS